jgi:hypothetical protein
VCHRRGIEVTKAEDLGVAGVDVDIGPSGSIEIVPVGPGDYRTYDGRQILRAHWAGPAKYGGELAYREIAEHFIAAAKQSGRLLEREAAAFSFAIGA